MNDLLSSASKICLIAVVLTICTLMFFGAATKQLEYRDLTIAFVGLLSALQGFYFANKGNKDKEFLGK